MRARPVEQAAGLLSLAAAAFHVAVTGEHFAEWWGYGLFFAAASIAQGLYGLVLLAMPARPAWPGGSWARFRDRLLGAGVAGNLAILGLYLVTRTVGVPAGPEAGEVEPWGTLDLASKATEALLIAALAWLRLAPSARRAGMAAAPAQP